MSDINFTIRKVFQASEKQKAVGINATFNITIDGPDGIIIALNDMKLMKNKEGKYYIDSPYRSYEGKDKEGNPKNVNIKYIKFFPEEKNWDKQDAIVRLVLDEIKNNPQGPRSSSSDTNTTNKAPNKPAAAKPATKTNDPW